MKQRDMEQISMFDNAPVYSPLASRMRPESLEDFQAVHLLRGIFASVLIERDQVSSMIF